MHALYYTGTVYLRLTTRIVNTTVLSTKKPPDSWQRLWKGDVQGGCTFPQCYSDVRVFIYLFMGVMMTQEKTHQCKGKGNTNITHDLERQNNTRQHRTRKHKRNQQKTKIRWDKTRQHKTSTRQAKSCLILSCLVLRFLVLPCGCFCVASSCLILCCILVLSCVLLPFP